MSERPGGTREIDRQIAEILGWRELVEIDGAIDLAGIPPGATNAEPVPFYSSIGWLADRAVEECGLALSCAETTPWKLCELIIETSKEMRRGK